MTLDTESLLMNAIKGANSSIGENKVKKVKKDILEEKLSEGVAPVELSNALSSSVSSFDEIAKKNKRKVKWDIKHSELKDWTNRDFAIYMSQCYKERYGTPWDMKMVAVVTYIGNVKESLRQGLGFCDNIVFKDYINYFYENWLDKFRFQSNVVFWLRQMKEDQVLAQFCEIYDYAESLSKQNKVEEVKEKKPLVVEEKPIDKEKEMENTYLLSIDVFVAKFGFITAINYLINKKNFTEEKAIERLANVIVKLYNQKTLEKVINITKMQSPYPASYSIRNLNKLFTFVKEKSSINIEDISVDFAV